jgi:hypothetical protein
MVKNIWVSSFVGLANRAQHMYHGTRSGMQPVKVTQPTSTCIWRPNLARDRGLASDRKHMAVAKYRLLDKWVDPLASQSIEAPVSRLERRRRLNRQRIRVVDIRTPPALHGSLLASLEVTGRTSVDLEVCAAPCAPSLRYLLAHTIGYRSSAKCCTAGIQAIRSPSPEDEAMGNSDRLPGRRPPPDPGVPLLRLHRANGNPLRVSGKGAGFWSLHDTLSRSTRA